MEEIPKNRNHQRFLKPTVPNIIAQQMGGDRHLDEAKSSAKVAWLEWIVLDEENFVEKCEFYKNVSAQRRSVPVPVEKWEGIECSAVCTCVDCKKSRRTKDDENPLREQPLRPPPNEDWPNENWQTANPADVLSPISLGLKCDLSLTTG
eukprot:scaffold40492_cov56-Attheya_sp.AAC.4